MIRRRIGKIRKGFDSLLARAIVGLGEIAAHSGIGDLDT